MLSKQPIRAALNPFLNGTKMVTLTLPVNGPQLQKYAIVILCALAVGLPVLNFEYFNWDEIYLPHRLIVYKNNQKLFRRPIKEKVIIVSKRNALHFYRPQRSWGKVIFSETCVKYSVHGGGACVVVVGGACMAGGAWLGGMHGWACMAGGYVWGACMAGGMCGGCVHGGGCVAGGRAWQILRDSVNELAVRILLECILVLIKFAFYFQYYHYIEIAIKQCKGSGIDCKVHGLSVVGRLRSDDDEGTASFTFLASDNEEEEERSNIPQVAASKQKLKHAGLCQVSLN